MNLWPLALGILATALMWHAQGFAISPDGRRYLAMADGKNAPTPFNRRWLLPLALGKHVWRWRTLSLGSVALMPVLVAALVPERPIVAAALMAFLPIQRVNVRFPVLVDAPAMALALGSAVAFRHGHVGFAVLLATMAGACKETAPIFAGLYAWHWLPLVGLLALIGQRTPGPSDGDPYSGKSMLEAAKVIVAQRRHDFLNWLGMVLPWGAIVPLYVLGGPTLKSLAALGVGYAQLLVATDNARLYQWAAPCVIAVAAHGASGPWLLVALVAHAFNPYRGI